MATAFLDTPVEFLKGVGPSRAGMLNKELGIFSFRDILQYYPFRYVDRTKFTRIADISNDALFVQIRAKLIRVQKAGNERHQRIIATVADSSGELDLVWFQGTRWVLEMLTPRQEYIIFGKPAIFNGRWNIAHPELEIPSEQPLDRKSVV